MSDAVRESLSGVIKSRLARETLLDRPPRLRIDFDALDRILGGGLSPGLIISNCDNCLYLGRQDMETVTYISYKANKTPDTVLNLPLGEAYLFTKGTRPKRGRRFELKSHQRYQEFPEAHARQGQRDGPERPM